MRSIILGAQMLYKALLGEQLATEIGPGCRERLPQVGLPCSHCCTALRCTAPSSSGGAPGSAGCRQDVARLLASPQALLEAARINQDVATAYAALARYVLHGNGAAATQPPALSAPPSGAAVVLATAAAAATGAPPAEAGPRGEPLASLGVHPVHVSEQELAVLCALRGDPGSAASLAVWLAARLGGHELAAPPLPPPPPPPPGTDWLQAELAMERQLAGQARQQLETLDALLRRA